MKTNEIITQYLPPDLGGPILDDLAHMERELRDTCLEAGELSAALERAVCSGGKRLRPLLARICWSIAGENGRIVPLMSMLELMHSASLIHDDLVDGAATRRGRATINATEGRKAAMDGGDFLLARAMGLLHFYRGTGINEALSEVAQEMCLGELDQHRGLFDPCGISRELYFSRIRRKTAFFMAQCCRAGSIAGGAADHVSVALAQYGMELGMAFQIRDDLLDWEDESSTGKAMLQDLRSGVITLPAICALEKAPALAPLLGKREKSGEDCSAILDCIKATGAIEEASAELRARAALARKALSPLPHSPLKTALGLLAKSISEVNFSG